MGRPHTFLDDTTKRVLAYLKPYKWQLLVAGFYLLASTIISFLQPLVIRQITDEGMMRKDVPAILISAGILALLVMANQFLELAQTKLFVDIHNATYFRIFDEVFQKLMKSKKSFYEDQNSTEIMHYLQTDVSQVSSITDQYSIMSLSYIFRIVSGFIGLLIISWKLTLLVISVIPLKLFIVHVSSKRHEEAVDKSIEESREFSRWFGDNVNGVNEIKLWGLYKKKEDEFKKIQERMLVSQKRCTMIGAWNSFWEMIVEWSLSVLLYVIGGILVSFNGLTIGAVFAFVTYSSFVTAPLSSLLNIKLIFSQVLPSARRLFTFLDSDLEEENGNKEVHSIPPRIEFRNVSFQYDDNRPIIKDIDFQVSPGEKVAIIGKNGSGKTTIIELLLRFYNPKHGSILINGIPSENIPIEQYRNLFSVVPQNPYLFFDDIKNNIDLKGNATKLELNNAIQVSGADSFISRLPNGSKTKIGQNGAKLSGGEKQKLAVARAILKDAPIFILDEASTNYDVESISYFHSLIVNRLTSKSVILISHQYADLKGMDRIYEINNGRIVDVSNTYSN